MISVEPYGESSALQGFLCRKPAAPNFSRFHVYFAGNSNVNDAQ